MLALMTVKFRVGASLSQTKATAQLLQRRLQDPQPGVTIHSAVMDLGAGVLYVLADFAAEAVTNIERTLEFRLQPAVESTSFTPVVDAQEALAVYLRLAG